MMRSQIEHDAAAQPQPPDTVEIRVEDLTVVPVEPGDVVLVRHRGRLDISAIRAVHDHVARHFPGHEVLVLDEGMELALLRPPRFNVVCGVTLEGLIAGSVLRCVLDEGHDADAGLRIHRTADGTQFSVAELPAQPDEGEPR